MSWIVGFCLSRGGICGGWGQDDILMIPDALGGGDGSAELDLISRAGL